MTTYLRVIESKEGVVIYMHIDIFEGDIKADRDYQRKYQHSTVRYFALEEVEE